MSEERYRFWPIVREAVIKMYLQSIAFFSVNVMTETKNSSNKCFARRYAESAFNRILRYIILTVNVPNADTFTINIHRLDRKLQM